MGVSTPTQLKCSECGADIPHHPRFRFETRDFCIRWLAVCQECKDGKD